MIPWGQELDSDWSGKSLSPQEQSQPKYASNLKFLRQRFLLFYQFAMSSAGATATLRTDRDETNSLSAKYKSEKQQWGEANKQRRLGTGFVARGNGAPIFVIKPSSVALAKKFFLLISQLLLFKIRIIFSLAPLTCCFVEQVLRFFKARFIFIYYST